MFGRKSILGVEIGRDVLRAVEVWQKGNNVTITSYGSMELPKTVLSEGNIVDSENFSEIFKSFYTQNGFSARQVVFGIDNQTSILRFATFPKVESAEKQRQLVLYNAHEYIPFPTADIIVDYIENQTVEEADGKKINVLLCAVKKSVVESLMACSRLSRLSIQTILPSSIAYADVLCSRVEEPDFMAIRVAPKSISHILYKNRSINFIRNVSLDNAAGSTLAAALRAESLHPDETQYLQEELLKGINATIDYYRLKNREEVNRVYMTGLSIMKGAMDKGLSDNLQVPVTGLRLFEPDARKGSSPPEDFESCISLVTETNRK